MVALGQPGGVQELEGDPRALGAELEQQLLDVVREGDRPSKDDSSGTAPWFYWMPFPGVRYYSHSDCPSPVERGNRSQFGMPARTSL